MRKLAKKMTVVLCLITALMSSTINVMAQSVRETEPNNTIDTARLFRRIDKRHRIT